MERKRNIDRLVAETLDSASGIEPVKTPPFFKDKVLSKMAQRNNEKEGVHYLNWLTPNYQAAILIALVTINAVALIVGVKDNKYVENVEDFAEVYGLSETDSYLYQN
ncbi:hypothetical protein [uncultured Croceitalea sp.]|uniref:hypothetical protein n=1 Tax=uncultured Croceitalea sp. TaxID=1798908 RepID=UPI0033068518